MRESRCVFHSVPDASLLSSFYLELTLSLPRNFFILTNLGPTLSLPRNFFSLTSSPVRKVSDPDMFLSEPCSSVGRSSTQSTKVPRVQQVTGRTDTPTSVIPSLVLELWRFRRSSRRTAWLLESSLSGIVFLLLCSSQVLSSAILSLETDLSSLFCSRKGLLNSSSPVSKFVSDVRGFGLFWAVEYKAPSSLSPRFATRVYEHCLELGLVTLGLPGTIDGKEGEVVMLAPVSSRFSSLTPRTPVADLAISCSSRLSSVRRKKSIRSRRSSSRRANRRSLDCKERRTAAVEGEVR